MSAITSHLARIEALCLTRANSDNQKIMTGKYALISSTKPLGTLDILNQCAGLAKGIINNKPLLAMVYVGSIVVGTSGDEATKALMRLCKGAGIVHSTQEELNSHQEHSSQYGI